VEGVTIPGHHVSPHETLAILPGAEGGSAALPQKRRSARLHFHFSPFSTNIFAKVQSHLVLLQ